jgi:hypothetical protein
LNYELPPKLLDSTKKPPRVFRGGCHHLSALDYFDGPLPGAVVAEPPAPLKGVDVPGLVGPDMLEPGEAMPVGLVSGVVLPGIAVPGIMFPVAGVLIVCAEAAPLIATAKAATRTKVDFIKTPVGRGKRARLLPTGAGRARSCLDASSAVTRRAIRREVLFARPRALVPASYSIDVILLLGLVFVDIDRFARHVAGVVMVLARLLFARLLRFRFLGITHHCTFLLSGLLKGTSKLRDGAF